MTEMIAKLLIIRQSSMGLGIYAARDIPGNTFLFEIEGNKLDFEATTTLNGKESYCLQTGVDEYIFTQPPFCYSNHSCDPNCGIRAGRLFYTLRPISRGEELTWDYSTSMLERHWTLECNCHTTACRSIIKDFDLLPKHLQARYVQLSVVMPFILEQLK